MQHAHRPSAARLDEVHLVLLGGTVHTMHPGQPAAEAVAISGQYVRAVGDRAAIAALAGERTYVIDLAGRTVLPGIHDAHLHLDWFARTRPPAALDLSTASSLRDVGSAVAAQAARLPAGSWIRGYGWDENRIEEFRGRRRGPARADLDEVTRDHAVVLTHWSSHALWVNTRALDAAGVDARSDRLDGIVRDRDGRGQGVLLEEAMSLVTERMPDPPPQERRDALLTAIQDLNGLGVTSITDPVVTPQLFADYERLSTERQLTMRIGALLHWDWPSVSTEPDRLREVVAGAPVSGDGDDRLRIVGAKLFADGVPSLRTAWMHRPYEGGGNGALVTTGDDDEARVASLREAVEILHRHRLRVQVHATGDRACDAVVDAFRRAQAVDPWPDARHTIIHGNLLSDDAAARLAAIGGGVIVNGQIKFNSAPALRSVLDPERWHRNFPVRSLLAAGVTVADASDAPIVQPDWRRSLETLVCRTVAGSDEVSGPGERIDRLAALRAWTAAPAWIEAVEDSRGTIKPGKLADLVVLDDDPLRMPGDRLHDLRITMTLLGGRVVHPAGATPASGGR